MGFFSDIAQSAFRKGENGEVIYLPNGIMSKGRVVTDSVREKQLRFFSKSTFKLLIPCLIFVMWYVDIKDPITFIPLIFIFLLEIGIKKYLIRDLPVYKGKYKSKKILEEGEDLYYPSVINIFAVLGFFFVALGLFFIVTSKEGSVGISLFPIFIGIVFFGASIFMFRANKSNKAFNPDAKKDSRPLT